MGEGKSSIDDGPKRERVILIIEDETELRELYRDWLATRYRVRTAATASEATAQFDEDVDVALIDRDLPDGTGETLLAELQTRTADCRFGMITAIEPEWKTVEMDFDAYLTKPVREDDIFELVDGLLEEDDLRLARHGDIIL